MKMIDTEFLRKNITNVASGGSLNILREKVLLYLNFQMEHSDIIISRVVKATNVTEFKNGKDKEKVEWEG